MLLTSTLTGLGLNNSDVPSISRRQAFFCCVLIVIGLVYFFLTTTSVSNSIYLGKDGARETHIVEIHSRIDQRIQVNIVTGNRNVQFTINDKRFQADYRYPKTRVSHQDSEFGDVYIIPLKAGTNKLIASSRGNINGFLIAQKRSIYELLAILILFCVPVFYLIQNYLIYTLEYLCAANYRKLSIPICLVIAAMPLRLWYYVDMGSTQFQHDYHGHIEYIEFLAKEMFVPLPHKAWEFPQQPLYYIVNGGLWALLSSWGIEKPKLLFIVSGISCVFSCIALIYAYRLVKKLSSDTLVQSLTVAFLGFVPTLTYMSTRISNDPWASSLSIIALFYIISSYQSGFQKYLVRALVFASAAFLTKVSAVAIEIAFLILLIVFFIDAKKDDRRKQSYTALISYAISGFFVLGYTLFRSYYPAPGAFSLVNSGIWGGQDLRPIGASYLFSFNFFDLFRDAQANISGTDNYAVTRSFPTYQYATMLFGEANYGYWKDRSYWLLANMQLMIILSLLIPISWFTFVVTKKNIVEKVFVFCIGLAIVLQLKFTFQYPSVSNTDFRYHAAVFFMMAFAFARGCSCLCLRFPKVRKVIYIWVSAMFALYASFVYTLIKI